MLHANIESAAEAVPAVLIERKAFAAALTFLCGKVIERRNTVPILSYVRLDATEDGGVRLFATDLDVQATLELPAAWETPGAVCLDAYALRDALKKCPGDEISLSFADGRATLESGRAVFQLPTLPVDDMPRFAELQPESAFELPAAVLERDLAALAPAMSKESEVRYYLAGVALQIRDAELCAIATDGSNLVRIRREAPAGAEALADSIIRAKFVQALRPLVKKGGDAPVRFEVQADRIAIDFDGVRLVSRLIDGVYPNWEPMPARVLGEELQTLAFRELEPRLALDAIAKLEKAAGESFTVCTGAEAASLTCEGFPEYLGISLYRRDGAPVAKGYAFGTDPESERRAREYAAGLAERYGLPAGEGGRVESRNGRAVGVTVGKESWEPITYEERTNWETLTVESVQVGGRTCTDVYYSIVIPAAERPCTSEISVTFDGVERPVANNGAAIALSAETVRAMCGDVADMPRVDIQPLQFLHGEVVSGLYLPTLRVFAPVGKRGKEKLRPMTDSEAMKAYCADPVGTMAALAPVPLESSTMPETAGEYAEPMQSAAPEPVETPAVETATTEPEALESAPSPAPAAIEPANEAEGVTLEALAARVAKLESLAVAEAPAQPEPIIEPVCQLNARRLRIVKRYLAMRAERAELRKSLAAAVAGREELRDRLNGETARAHALGSKAKRAEDRLRAMPAAALVGKVEEPKPESIGIVLSSRPLPDALQPGTLSKIVLPAVPSKPRKETSYAG